MLDADRLRHRVGFLAGRHALLVEPRFPRRLPLREEQQICADAAYGLNTLLGRRTIVCRSHSSKRCSLSRVLTPSPNSVPSGSTTAARRPASRAHDQGQEQVGRLARLEVPGEVPLDVVLLPAAERRIGEDHVHAVGLGVADVGPGQGVVVPGERRIFDAVQEELVTQSMCGSCFFSVARRLACMVRSLGGRLDVAAAHCAAGHR